MKGSMKTDDDSTVLRAALDWVGKLLTFVGTTIWAIVSVIITTVRHHLWLLRTTGKRDLWASLAVARAYYTAFKYSRNRDTAATVFEQKVDQHPNKLCLVTHEKQWTFKQVDEYANRVCRFFTHLGLEPGNEVVIFLESCPVYIATILGFCKMGVVPALVNTNLRDDQLLHSIGAIDAKAIVFGAELLDAIRNVSKDIRPGIELFCVGDFDATSFRAKSLDLSLQEVSPERPLTTQKRQKKDRLFYIYTSGTTGLPKAAIISNAKYIFTGSGLHYLAGMNSEDVMYTCLPLYHSAAGMLASSQCTIQGCTLAIRKKFSASNFFEDCKKFNVTVTHYIGEICRYLLTRPESPADQDHKVRIMCGNGLRSQIWEKFQTRFNITTIGELYGSTEGNANVANIDGKVGAVGFISQLIPTCLFPVNLIKMDTVTGEPVRGANGLCIRCKPGESGQFVGKINQYDPMRTFDGYLNETATKKKITKDVFSKGDYVFLTGDLLVMDAQGYLFFLDRTGDTFRWKGENVSTSEVENIVTKILSLSDCVIYGATIPGTEGKAGMVAFNLNPEDLDFGLFLKNLKNSLPAYSIPMFIRFVKEIEATSTYKLKKGDLQKEGYDPKVVKDPLFYLNSKEGCYSKLDHDIYEQIVTGKIRF